MRTDWVYRRGDIYFANLNPYCGSEQGGARPVVVLQNNTANKFSPTLIVAVITTRNINEKQIPTHCRLYRNKVLKKDSVVALEQIKTIDKKRIRKFLGKMNEKEMKLIDHFLLKSIGIQK